MIRPINRLVVEDEHMLNLYNQGKITAEFIKGTKRKLTRTIKPTLSRGLEIVSHKRLSLSLDTPPQQPEPSFKPLISHGPHSLNELHSSGPHV